MHVRSTSLHAHMEVKQVAQLPSSRAGGGKIPVAVSAGQDHLTIACSGVDSSRKISLFRQHLPTAAQVVVGTAGHTEPVQALQFSPGAESLLLCSASHSNTLLWDVDSLLREGMYVNTCKGRFPELREKIANNLQNLCNKRCACRCEWKIMLM